MKIVSIICTNKKGDSITIGNRPFRLIEDPVLSGLSVELNYLKGNDDGSTYLGSRLNERDIPIVFALQTAGLSEDWIQERRFEVFQVFNPTYNPVRMVFQTVTGKSFVVNANVATTPTWPTGVENSNPIWQRCLVQMSANDPSLYDIETKKTEIATWFGALEFGSLELSSTGKEIGTRSPSLIVNVFNEGQDKTGMTIKFKSSGTVVNPSLVNVNTQEFIKLYTTMIGGDEITISTYKGKRKVERLRNNEVSNIFNTLDIDSSFLQLDTEDNLFRYYADSGVDLMESTIYFTPKYLGV